MRLALIPLVLLLALTSGCLFAAPGAFGEAPDDGESIDTTRAPASPVVRIAISSNFGCAVRESGETVCWGGDWRGHECPENERITTVRVPGVGPAVDVVAYDHACLLEASGRVFCWGQNWTGQLGSGTVPHEDYEPTQRERRTPVLVDGLSDAVQVAVGGLHSCALRATGQMVCWGNNDEGQLGDGTRTMRPSPVPVRRLTFDPRIATTDGPDSASPTEASLQAAPTIDGPVAEMALGSRHSCARLETGTVVCWGSNTRGQLGDGTEEDSRVPVRVEGLSDAVQISAGGARTCALRATGDVVCWGDQVAAWREGASTPLHIEGLGQGAIDEVRVSSMHICVRNVPGDVICWGSNRFEQLGRDVGDHSYTPRPVRGVGFADQVAVSRTNSCVLEWTGQVQCWGYNITGALGDGTTRSGHTPRPVVGLR